MEPGKPYSVRELNREIIELLEAGFNDIRVEGEIGSLRKPPSGHVYFNLKEDNEIIRVVFFRGALAEAGLDFALEDGQQVIVRGRVSGYAGRSEYQVIARGAEKSGLGKLLAAFEALKKKLREEGLFDEARKRPVPEIIRRLGVVTSPTGAAIRDIMAVLERRNPAMELVIYPALVQGPEAAGQVARGVEELNRRGGFDALLLTRGGGSLEDLWPFNEEIVARAVVASAIPVISAVGHEVDFTICDFVADLRAPTPSAAAEMISRHQEEKRALLDNLKSRLFTAAGVSLRAKRQAFESLAGRYGFRRPRELLEKLAQGVDDFSERLARAMRHGMERRRHRFEKIESSLRVLSPRAVLERGYSITSLAGDGRVLRAPGEAPDGVELVTMLARGTLRSRVTGGEENTGGVAPPEPPARKKRPAKPGGTSEQGSLF